MIKFFCFTDYCLFYLFCPLLVLPRTASNTLSAVPPRVRESLQPRQGRVDESDVVRGEAEDGGALENRPNLSTVQVNCAQHGGLLLLLLPLPLPTN